jgi:hypothetical protein
VLEDLLNRDRLAAHLENKDQPEEQQSLQQESMLFGIARINAFWIIRLSIRVSDSFWLGLCLN